MLLPTAYLALGGWFTGTTFVTSRFTHGLASSYLGSGLVGRVVLQWWPLRLRRLWAISLWASSESLALRIGILELQEGRGAAKNGVNMDRLSSAWDQLAGLALIFIWTSGM